MDWVEYHQAVIGLWEGRRGFVINGQVGHNGMDAAIRRYMRWFRSWATLYMLKAPIEQLDTYYQRAPVERILCEHILESEDVLRHFFGRENESPVQQVLNRFEEMCTDLRHHVQISDSRYRDIDEEGTSSGEAEGAHVGEAGPSTYTEEGPSSAYQWYYPTETQSSGPILTQFHQWPIHATQWGGSHGGIFSQPQTAVGMPPVMFQFSAMLPGSFGQQISAEQHGWFSTPNALQQTPAKLLHNDLVMVAHHQLRDRPRQGPHHYTPGTDAIPCRKQRRQRKH